MSQYAQPQEDWRLGQSSIVGRVHERQLLHDLLLAALDGRGGLVLIDGEAGIGKTTLVDDLSRRAGKHGVLSLTSGCYDYMSARPYAPWIEIMTAYASMRLALPQSGNANDSDRTLPPVPDELLESGALGGPESKQALFDAITEFIRLVSRSLPLLLVFEDMHSADADSLDLLRHVGHSLGNVAVLVVATYCDEELTRQHPLFKLLPVLVGETHAERIALRRIDRSATQALISTRYLLADDDAERLNVYVYQQAEGNPFFVGELLRALEDNGVLRRDGAGWLLGSLERAHVPTLVRQVIETRLGRLGVDVRRALQIAAVIGQEVDYHTWLGVSGLNDDILLSVMERSIDAHVVQETTGGAGVRFTHALVRQSLYESVIGPRRRSLHRQVAELLAAGPRPDPDRVAFHYQQAGDARGAAWFCLAAEHAQRVYAWLTAAEQLEAAIALLDATGEHASERSWLLYRLALMRRYDDSQASIRHLEDIGRQAIEIGDRVLGACAQHDCGIYRSWEGDVRSGLADMEAAVSVLDDLLPTERERFHALDRSLWRNKFRYWDTLVLWLSMVGRYADAAVLAARESSPGGPTFGVAISGANTVAEYAEGYYGLGDIYANTGQPTEARRAYQRARDAYRLQNHHYQVAWTALDELTWVIVPYYSDDVAARYRLADEAVQAWIRSRATTVEQVPDLPRLWILYLEGKWREAHQIISRARDAVAGASVAVPVLTALAYYQGDSEAARDLIRLILPEGATTAPGDTYFASAIAVQRLASAVELDGGNLERAHAWLEAHDRWLAWSGSMLGRAEGQLLWARFHDAAGDDSRAREHARAALEHASEPRQPFTLLTVQRFLGELDTGSGNYGAAEMQLREALALADACAVPFERAFTLLALAELRAATDQIDDARTLLDEVQAICDPIGAAPALARASVLRERLGSTPATVSYPAGLTSREVDVLRLVAEGLSNAEVGERLFMARRTVNTHLTSIYTKLNVNSRAAATRFAVEHGIT